MTTKAENYETGEDPERSRDILEEHVYLNVVRVKQQLEQAYVELCKRHGVTHQQYNVLRILYVRGKLPSSEISNRLIIRSPDITRLLNRMEEKDLIDRELSREDRRVVLAKLTPKGKKTCENIDEELVVLHQKQMNHMSREELDTLNQLLVKLLGRT